MRLPQAPQIVIVEPLRGENNQPVPSLDKLAGGWVVPGVGPLITFRAEVFGTDRSLLSREEALGVIAHELFHIAAIFQRGAPLPDYERPPAFRPLTEKARLSARALPFARAWRKEESGADRNAVRLGRGRAFLSGLDQLVAYAKNQIEANPGAYHYPVGTTYADVLNREGALADHPLDPTRRIRLVRAIERQERQDRRTGAGKRPGKGHLISYAIQLCRDRPRRGFVAVISFSLAAPSPFQFTTENDFRKDALLRRLRTNTCPCKNARPRYGGCRTNS